MWKFLYDNYGCRPVITIRYFISNPDGILPSIYKDTANNLNREDNLDIYQESIISEKTLRNLNNDASN